MYHAHSLEEANTESSKGITSSTRMASLLGCYLGGSVQFPSIRGVNTDLSIFLGTLWFRFDFTRDKRHISALASMSHCSHLILFHLGCVVIK